MPRSVAQQTLPNLCLASLSGAMAQWRCLHALLCGQAQNISDASYAMHDVLHHEKMAQRWEERLWEQWAASPRIEVSSIGSGRQRASAHQTPLRIRLDALQRA